MKKAVDRNVVKHFTMTVALAASLSGVFTYGNAYAGENAVMNLLPDSWAATVNHRPVARLGNGLWSDTVARPENIADGFNITLTTAVAEPTRDRRILEIPGVADVSLRQHNPLDRNRQNYPAYPMPDGTVPVLEATLYLDTPAGEKSVPMTVGLPLAMLDNPFGTHEVSLNFTGEKWTMYVDGHLADNDFPFGYPDMEKWKSWNVDPEFVSDAAISYPALRYTRSQEAGGRVPVQYWTPPGHNSWVGDVVSLWHDGAYHLFYLYDRRGHQSKLGRGGHYFEHISTRDFIHWTEHEAAVPIDEQWETFGTGTPFVHNGRIHISYGYHTTRLYPYEVTSLPAMSDSLKKNGHTDALLRCPENGIPAGSSYSVSEDGVNFKKTGILFHPCENPSIYTDPDSGFVMLANYGAKGTWVADSVDGPWRCVNENFPTGGDCTFLFNLGDYDYIIGGFSNMWMKRSCQGGNEYADVVAAGNDFYNGMCVPSVAKTGDGRCLMAGWMWLKEWGGPLVIHEVVQDPDGRLGTKWMDELIPSTSGSHIGLSTGETTNIDESSFLLTFDVEPISQAQGSIRLQLLPEERRGSQDGCEWSLDRGEKRAQYSAAGMEHAREKSLREGGEPQRGRNYAIENVAGTDGRFAVRVVVRYSQKFDGSIVDTEIAGRRTMLSFREKLKTGRLHLDASDVKISNVRLSPLNL